MHDLLRQPLLPAPSQLTKDVHAEVRETAVLCRGPVLVEPKTRDEKNLKAVRLKSPTNNKKSEEEEREIPSGPKER